ncbi:hypothetical protein C1645_832804, partial [Glomus cerebriforme]
GWEELELLVIKSYCECKNVLISSLLGLELLCNDGCSPSGSMNQVVETEMPNLPRLVYHIIEEKIYKETYCEFNWYMRVIPLSEELYTHLLEKAAKERSEMLRVNYILTIGTYYNSEQLIFLDKSSKDERILSRQYGYSFKNTRAIQKVVFLRGTRYTTFFG